MNITWVYLIIMSKIVRGNVIMVVDTPPACIAQKFPHKDKWGICLVPKIGDELIVAARKKNGWLRVTNARTDLTTSLRTGPWVKKVAEVWGRKQVVSPAATVGPSEYPSIWSHVVPAAAAALNTPPVLVCDPPPAGPIDQFIYNSKINRLEAENNKLSEQTMRQSAKIAQQEEQLRADVALNQQLEHRSGATHLLLREQNTKLADHLTAAENYIAELVKVTETDDELLKAYKERILELEQSERKWSQYATVLELAQDCDQGTRGVESEEESEPDYSYCAPQPWTLPPPPSPRRICSAE